MKKTILFITICLLSFAGTHAQISKSTVNKSGDSQKEAKIVVSALQKNIEVSDYQSKAVLKILTAFNQERSNALQITDKTKKVQRIEAIDKKQEANLRNVLNDQQYTMLEHLIKENKKKS